MARPSNSLPFISEIAVSAALSSSKVTKPNPRDRPVSRLVMTLASVISPKRLKAASKSALVVFQDKLPTNSFFITSLH
jgi:hypothetical protein